MNISQITSLFILFSGETDINKYQPLIDSSILQVSRQLKEGASSADIRLDYLCAAIANYRYSQLTCVKNKVAYTYAGTADSKGNSQMEYDLAKELMCEYYKAAADLLCDDDFVFSAVCSG
ncbi:MAG: hypothetical protein MR503_08635 [Oscillospiraceae bacterium]|nr:hypothetical protein [Oscillospiraceae bacterium]